MIISAGTPVHVVRLHQTLRLPQCILFEILSMNNAQYSLDCNIVFKKKKLFYSEFILQKTVLNLLFVIRFI